MLRKLIDLQYDRSDVDFRRGTFRVRGDTVEVFPANEEQGFRLSFYGDQVNRIDRIDPLLGKSLETAGQAVGLRGEALRDAGGQDIRRGGGDTGRSWSTG